MLCLNRFGLVLYESSLWTLSFVTFKAFHKIRSAIKYQRPVPGKYVIVLKIHHHVNSSIGIGVVKTSKYAKNTLLKKVQKILIVNFTKFYSYHYTSEYYLHLYWSLIIELEARGKNCFKQFSSGKK